MPAKPCVLLENNRHLLLPVAVTWSDYALALVENLIVRSFRQRWTIHSTVTHRDAVLVVTPVNSCECVRPWHFEELQSKPSRSARSDAAQQSLELVIWRWLQLESARSDPSSLGHLTVPEPDTPWRLIR